MNKRLHSLDVLRGMDMIWIMGLAEIFHQLAKVNDASVFQFFADQARHIPWIGFRLHDWIFPLFMFISGISLVFSVNKQLEKGISHKHIALKILKRSLILVFLGVVYNGLGYIKLETIRIASVLGQIGIAYLFAGLIVLYFPKVKAQIGFFAGIIVSVMLIQLFIPVPEFGAGVFKPEATINAFIDQLMLPGKPIYGTYDPEGILCIFSAISTTLGGSLIAHILMKKDTSENKKTLTMIIVGVGMILLALLLSTFYPIIKKVWTGSFSLLTVGMSTIYLAIIYYIVDVKGFHRWSYIFKIIGMNSIGIYMLYRFVNFHSISEKLLTNVGLIFGDYSFLIVGFGAICLELYVLHIMYKNKIFFKV